MRRLLTLALAAGIILTLSSCSASSSGDNTPERIAGGQTKVSQAGNRPVSDGNNNAAVESGFFFTYNGVKLVLDTEVEPVIKELGKEYIYTENPSCAYVGIDYTYDYKSLIIFAQEKGGKIVIDTVEARNDTVDCNGIKVGQSFDDVKKVFGEPTSVEDFGITYVKNGIKLQFLSDGSGKVITISLTHETPEA